MVMFKRGRSPKRYHVFAVLGRDGIWMHRAYEIDGSGDYRKTSPPKNLEKKFVCLCTAHCNLDAIRAAVECK